MVNAAIFFAGIVLGSFAFYAVSYSVMVGIPKNAFLSPLKFRTASDYGFWGCTPSFINLTHYKPPALEGAGGLGLLDYGTRNQTSIPRLFGAFLARER